MTQDPPRLLDSPETSPAEREMLDAARTLSPVHYDAAAGAARLHAALQSAAVGGTSAGVGMSLGIKATLALLVAGAAYTGYLTLQPKQSTRASTARPVPVAAPAAIAARAPTQAPAPTSSRIPTPATTPSEPETAVEPSDAVTRNAAGARPKRAKPTAAHSNEVVAATPAVPEQTPTAAAPRPAADQTTPSPSAASSGAPRAAAEAHQTDQGESQLNELRAIARARQLLTRDPAEALAILQRLERELAKGYFVEERLALTTIALARLGRDDEAAQRGKAFLRAYPYSPHAARVRQVLPR